MPHPARMPRVQHAAQTSNRPRNRRPLPPTNPTETSPITIAYKGSVPGNLLAVFVCDRSINVEAPLPSKALGENSQAYPAGTPAAQASCTCCPKAPSGSTPTCIGREPSGVSRSILAPMLRLNPGPVPGH